LNLSFCGAYSLGGPIGTVRGDGIQGVGNREDSCAQGNLITLQTPGITGSVEFLLMGIDNIGGLSQKRNLLQHLITVIAMLTHNRHFVRCKSAGLAKDGIGNCHLSDVVQKGSTGNDSYLVIGNSHYPGDGDGECSHPFGVAFGFSILQIQCIAQRFQRDVVGALKIGPRFFQLPGTRINLGFQVGLVGAIFQF